ncbi:uncharacterized protein LOC131000105 [Salvia miltiorrhiza]|uniref:uncharacterized protein LOC131000105 n=1 Tax=Salvia miltiorrhiza TaxID=226208 RepID=UPI0025AD8A2B|nr:uncharacterized protein LOC131000105 [Salvia miltiorrhiza]
MGEVADEKKGMATTPTVSMKLLVDTQAKRVLFAEAGKDCIDFLFQILSLPVATVIGLLRDESMAGSWPNLYKSLMDLSDGYIQPNQSKDAFLKPVAPVSSSSMPLLALNDAQIQKKFYDCEKCNGYFTDDPRAVCPACNELMTSDLEYVAPPAVPVAAESGGLVKGVITYMVMDDLEVKPMSTISSIALLNKFNVKDVGALEEKVVTLGMTEALMLLKYSHQSKNVLTHVFC